MKAHPVSELTLYFMFPFYIKRSFNEGKNFFFHGLTVRGKELFCRDIWPFQAEPIFGAQVIAACVSRIKPTTLNIVCI